ncbi:hypothetical protein NC652_034180 [Populus alba x Populus x berolinensis]|nr:hypothetical protein NC652_034180 [Populus alba x Populus x berolinensis]
MFLTLINRLPEEQLAGLFIHCGQVVDCPVYVVTLTLFLRFAFELRFTVMNEDGKNCIKFVRTSFLDITPLRVLPSKKLLLHLLTQHFCQGLKTSVRYVQGLFIVQILTKRSPRQMSSSSLNPFVERFIA